MVCAGIIIPLGLKEKAFLYLDFFCNLKSKTHKGVGTSGSGDGRVTGGSNMGDVAIVPDVTGGPPVAWSEEGMPLTAEELNTNPNGQYFGFNGEQNKRQQNIKSPGNMVFVIWMWKLSFQAEEPKKNAI
jgi:hypothetical protein